MKKARPQLVIDCLTILRAYINADRPVALRKYGSFDDWALVREALVWLGCADPLDTRSIVRADDPELEERAELCVALLRVFKIGELFNIKRIGETDGQVKSDIARLMVEGRWDSKRAGRLLTKHLDVPLLGVTLRSRVNAAKARDYWIEGVPEDALLEAVNTPPIM